jgi:DNA-directed RNA polymerase specialized sigma24 family protein
MRSEAREAAYVEFVTARQTQLRRIAYAVCGDWERADEVLQSALTKLYVAWPRLRREGTEEAYVRRILVRSHVEARQRGVQPPDPTSLFDALQSLPAKQRKAVLLRHWLGLSLEETAEDLAMTIGSVATHAERGLASLQDALARDVLAREGQDQDLLAREAP